MTVAFRHRSIIRLDSHAVQLSGHLADGATEATTCGHAVFTDRPLNASHRPDFGPHGDDGAGHTAGHQRALVEPRGEATHHNGQTTIRAQTGCAVTEAAEHARRPVPVALQSYQHQLTPPWLCGHRHPV